MEIVVNKSNTRHFLTLCAKVAAAEKKEDREFLFLTALKEGVFKWKISGKPRADRRARNITNEKLAKFFAGHCDRLGWFVSTFAYWINDGEDFELRLRIKNTKIIYADKKVPAKWSLKKSYYFFKDRPKDWIVNNPDDYNEGTIHEGGGDFCMEYFIDHFVDAMEDYREKRDLTWLQVPLRICEWCHKPFFGSRYDQRFCTKIHGQRWHANNSYEKKKD